jgi:hypothetical protein
LEIDGYVRLAYQPSDSSTFLSEQTSHQQPANITFLSEQISISHQPSTKRMGWMPLTEHRITKPWIYGVEGSMP